MQPIIKQVASDVSLSVDTILEKTEAYFSDHMLILKPNYLVEKESYLNSYHFVIPSSDMPLLKVDKELHNITPKLLFATNPGQRLFNTMETKIETYTTFFIDKSYFENIARISCRDSKIRFVNDSFMLSPALRALLKSFVFETRTKQTAYELILETLTAQIAILLLREIKNNSSAVSTDSYYTGDKNLDRAIEYIWDNYNQTVSLQELSCIANLSSYHFIRVFKSCTGKTPYEYLLDIKIQKAVEMLNANHHSITEISSLCGFSTPSHFTTVFKKKTGLTPSAYKKMII